MRRPVANAIATEPPAPAELVALLSTYLEQHPTAAILEDGRILFDLRTARCSVTESHGRCVLQLWSEERNLVRTVVSVETRARHLRLMTRRMGAPRPTALDLVPSSDRRVPTTRESGRRNYQRLLERVLTREFLGAKVEGMRTAMDLEHSFGPAYIRGRLMRGTAAHAVVGVSRAESATVIDGVLTVAILWLEYCREHQDGRRHFGGLKIIVPAGAARVTAERMTRLNRAAAEFELYTLEERSEELIRVDIEDSGNFHSRLIQAFAPEAAIDRCRPGLDRVLALANDSMRARVEFHAHSAFEVGLLLHGLEFARVRHATAAQSFTRLQEVTFGAGANETPLDEATEPMCRALLQQLFQSRHPHGSHDDPLFRMQPERWLESRMRHHVVELLPDLHPHPVYAQVPAMSSGERGLLDLLALDRNGRLVVVELKADDDLHLPLQALDYWLRVRALNDDRRPGVLAEAQSAFTRAGYFPGLEISPLPPRLILAAPALRVHPANETVLRTFSPEIEWEFLGLSEQWRSELKAVFRKSSRHR